MPKVGARQGARLIVMSFLKQFGTCLEFLSYSLETLHAGAEILQDL